MRSDEFIGECRVQTFGCQVLFLRWRRDRKPVCSNLKCRSAFYRRIRRLLGMEGFTLPLILRLIDERKPVPVSGLPSADEVRPELEKLILSCEVQAPGCKGVVLLYRKDKLRACSNLKCRKRAEQRRMYRAGRAS